MWARDNGGEVITVLLDNDAMHLRARCEGCQRQAKVFYTHQGKTACRKCLGLGSAKRFQSRAQRRARQPDAVKLATDAAKNFLKTDDHKQLSAAMTILNNVPETEAPDELDEVQAFIVRDDITRLSNLMAKVEQQLYSGVENHTDRRGDSSTIPLRADSFAKLGNLFIAASTARAARSGIAERLRIESRTTEGTGKSMAEILLDEARASDWRMQNGQSVDEFEAHRETLRALPEPKSENLAAKK